jgi:VanZ family protein
MQLKELFTSQQAKDSATLAARTIGWCLVVVITVLSLVPAWLRPETGVPHKLEHFGIFVLTGFAFGLGYNRRFFLVILSLVLFTGATELAQFLVAGRHARLMDFVVDGIAVCIGAVIGKIIASQAWK